MLEWYRAGENVDQVMDDTLALVRRAAGIAGTGRLRHRDRSCDPAAEAERLGVADAFRIHAGIELLDTLDDHGQGNRDILATRAKRAGFQVAAEDGWSDIFSKVLAAAVEPRLGLDRLTLLTDYPRQEAALARPKPSDPRLSERFEVYACGVELANGFGELTDPWNSAPVFEAEMDEKQRVHGERYPLDEEFLAALAQMPPASGVALGFDRLVMLAAGAPPRLTTSSGPPFPRSLKGRVAQPGVANFPGARHFPRAMTDTTAARQTAHNTTFAVLFAISFSHLLNDMMQSLIPAIYPNLKADFHQLRPDRRHHPGQPDHGVIVAAGGALCSDHRPRPYSLATGMIATLIGLLILSVAGSYLVILFSVMLIGVGSAVFHPGIQPCGAHGVGRTARVGAVALFQVGGNTRFCHRPSAGGGAGGALWPAQRGLGRGAGAAGHPDPL